MTLFRLMSADWPTRRLPFSNPTPSHPSLHFKKLGKVWSVRVGLHYRAIAVEVEQSFVWIWIGSHAEYDKLLNRN